MLDVTEMTDREAAEAVRDGRLESPTKYGDFWLFDLRVTGTGAAFRDSLGEWAVRDPKTWATPEFAERCAGLPVIFEHPERSGLDSKEFQERAIGMIVLPYVRDDEVWGIAKIYDADSAELMQSTHTSTSPGVLPPKDSTVGRLKDGSEVLVEGLPLVLDHLAICSLGVWDKDGPARGIRLDRKDGPVATKTAEEYEREIDDMKKRADAIEKERDDAMRRLDAAEKEKEREDKAKKDESDREAIEAAEKEKEKQDKSKKDADAKRDARKDRHAKHDGADIMDCAKCDSEETEEEKSALEAAEKAKKDAAAAKQAEVDAERGTQLHDSKEFKALRAELDMLKNANRPLSNDERGEIAAAHARADRAYQMLGDQTPHAYPGETPLAYRKRLANGLRQYTKGWKTYAFHDAQQTQDFQLVEDAIFNEALAYAKNPPSEGGVGKVREIVSHPHGKTRTEFIGDQRLVWAPFMQPTKFAVAKFNRPAGNVYR